MNEELVQRIVDQCVVKRERHGTTVDVLQSRKFAEMIVRECIRVPYDMWDKAELNADIAVKIDHWIKQHFGIEE